MAQAYKIVTPEQYGMRVWRPPYDFNGAEMRARYVLPHLEELRADPALFHPAGPYVSGETEFTFNQPSRLRRSGGSDSADVSPTTSVFLGTLRPFKLPTAHDDPDESTNSATPSSNAPLESFSRIELIKRIDTFVSRRHDRRRAQDQEESQAQQLARERLHVKRALLLQEEQRAREYLQIETQRQVDEQSELQALIDAEAATAALVFAELEHCDKD